MTPPHILIVGGGIVGTSLTYHLATKNVRVTLLEQATKPGGGMTQTSFGWLTVSPDAPDHYLALRQQAIADWHRIEQELNDQLRINWSGALRWWQTPTGLATGILFLHLPDGCLKESPVYYCKSTTEQQQIRRLQRELKEAQLERDILKKAVSIFSKTDERYSSL